MVDMMTREIRGTAALGATTDPKVRVVSYVTAKQRQALRVKAAEAGMSMSDYVARLIGQALEAGK